MEAENGQVQLVEADELDAEIQLSAEAEGEEAADDGIYIVLSDDDSEVEGATGTAVEDDTGEAVENATGTAVESATRTVAGAAKEGDATGTAPKLEDDEIELEYDAEDEETEKERAKVEEGFFADDLEMLSLTIPHQNLISCCAKNLWNSRKLIVHPVQREELQMSRINELLADVHCSQVTIKLEREPTNSEKWTGILDLVFDSKERTLEAAERLKQISSHINVLNAADVKLWNEDFDERRSTHFSSYELKKWISCVVCVKYLPCDISLEKLREIFPDAFEVMLHKTDSPNLTETQRLTGFLFYTTWEQAEEAFKSHTENKTSVDGVRLAFFKYDQLDPPERLDHHEQQLPTPSECVELSLSERYIILKERKIVEKLAKVRGGHCASTLEKFNKKIYEDDIIRGHHGLPTPTLDEMRVMKNLKVLRGDDAFKIIKQKGLLWRNRNKLLPCRAEALEPPVHPQNKGMNSALTNPNKRKRRKMAIESKIGFNAASSMTAPSLFHTMVEPVIRPPVRKLMRTSLESEYAEYEEEDYYGSDGTVYQEALPPIRIRPQMSMVRPLMARAGVMRAQVPRLLIPRSAPGSVALIRGAPVRLRPAIPGPRPDARLNSRLLNLAHGSVGSGGAPRQLMTQVLRPRLTGYVPTAAIPTRRPVAFVPRFPGAGVPMRRGAAVRMRPVGRAGWAVRR